MALTTGLAFLAQPFPGILFTRTEGIVWASSHFLSQLVVVATAWSLIILDRFKGVFYNVLVVFNLGSLHEIFYSRMFYIHNLSALEGTWLTLSVSIVFLIIGWVWAPKWQRWTLVFMALGALSWFSIVGQYFQPTVILSGGFNMPWASEVLPNASEIISWGILCLILVACKWRSRIIS